MSASLCPLVGASSICTEHMLETEKLSVSSFSVLFFFFYKTVLKSEASCKSDKMVFVVLLYLQYSVRKV